MPVRDLSAGIIARLGDRVVYPALFYEGTFWSVSLAAEQLVNAWSGLGSFSWDSKTWLGQGNLLGLSTVEETSEIRAIGFSVRLTGQTSTNISLALAAGRQGKAGKIWLGLLTQAGALADTPYQLRRGRLNTMKTTDDGGAAQIEVFYEGVLAAPRRSRPRRYTHADQQIDYAGDKGFEYIPSLQDVRIPWGRAG